MRRRPCANGAAEYVGRRSIVAVLSVVVAFTPGRAGAGDGAPAERGGPEKEERPAILRATTQQVPTLQQGEADSVTPQERTFDGRVIGPDGGAVSGLDVLLHRVTNQGGTQLARSVTAEDGRFTLQYQPPGDADGVFFVAARYDGRVYVGPMLRPPFRDVRDYVMQVGVPGVGDVEAFSRTRPDPSQGSFATPPATSAFSSGQGFAPGAVFVTMMLTAAITIGALLAVRGTGPSRWRRALIGLAELDEAGVDGPPPADVLRRRRELLRRARDA